MEQCESITRFIKAEALRLGFNACGIARAERVSHSYQKHYLNWLAEGKQAEMYYLTRNIEKRFDPHLLVEGTQSIVSVALNYYPTQFLRTDQYQFAWYAYGQDYHEVMKGKLNMLLQHIHADFPAVNGRAFCDTAPVLERYWAQQAGLGWIGKNSQLIVPQAGSTFFLGELFLDVPLLYDTPVPNHCGNCHQCLDACPAQALRAPSVEGYPNFDSRRCLSYQTIENRGEIPVYLVPQLGNNIYGCDACQKACPHLRFAKPHTEAALQPSPALLKMTRQEWQQLTVEQYRSLFKGSAVKRAKYEGLCRNIAAVTSNETSK